MAAEVHVGDIGTIFLATITDENNAVVDVSLASTKQLWFKKPDTTVTKKTASFTTNGTDGKLQYTTIAGDLDNAGVWEIQGYVVLAAGTWHTSRLTVQVQPNVVGAP